MIMNEMSKKCLYELWKGHLPTTVHEKKVFSKLTRTMIISYIKRDMHAK